MQEMPFFVPETFFLFFSKIFLDISAKIAQNNIVDDAWLSLVERCVRDAEAAGSNPVASRAECRSFPAFFFMLFQNAGGRLFRSDNLCRSIFFVGLVLYGKAFADIKILQGFADLGIRIKLERRNCTVAECDFCGV